MVARHREQLRELLTNYGKIDLLCLDQWMGKDNWPDMRETVKMIRKLQPNIMIRCRGIGNYGDYYTPEGFVPGRKENTNMPWMVIYPLGSSFSYDKNGGKYKGASWIIKNLADSVAKGGSFMVGIGPNKNGKFHPSAIKQLEQTGAWLKVNNEGIYETRPREVWKEGDKIRYTRSKDKKHVYAIHLGDLSQDTLTLAMVCPKAGSKITLLGHPDALDWTQNHSGIHIKIPSTLPNPGKLSKPAYVFRFDVDDVNATAINPTAS
jgi:alpha-L-fucosidase